jgi:predicted tellurium resistance membrane protein TerC
LPASEWHGAFTQVELLAINSDFSIFSSLLTGVGMADLFTTQNLVAFLTLAALEIVLGIDNVIFIAILSGKLPADQQARARSIGIGLAVGTRILLLLGITWVMQLTTELFWGLSGRDLILIVGGLFLIGKSTFEIHEKVESADHTQQRAAPAVVSFGGVIVQIILVDIIFSLDSVITAVGISGNLWVMVPAVVIAAAVMLFFAGGISRYVERHPTMKILALAFLILIGTLLVIEGWLPDVAHEYHLKNYAYFAMAFSFLVELVNMRFRGSASPVHLHNQPTLAEAEVAASSGSATTTTYEQARTPNRTTRTPRKNRRR